MNKKWINNNWWWLFLIVSFPIFIWIGKNNREKEKEINEKGMVTIGTVINRTDGRGTSPGNRQYGLHFDFYVGDSLMKNSSFRASEEEYRQAIIGMKYQIKYLPSKPNHDSRIFINLPVISAFDSITFERQRIRDTYKNADVFLRKNARDLNELGLK